MKLTLQRGIVGLLAAALLIGIVPLGAAVHGWLARALEERAREEVATAPAALHAQAEALGDALMMGAKDLAQTRGLPEAVAAGDSAAAVEILRASVPPVGDEPLLVAGAVSWAGPRPDPALLAATRAGEMPVRLVCDGETLRYYALAPLEADGGWVGAAGVTYLMDEAAAARLAGAARAEVVMLGKGGSRVSTLSEEESAEVAATLASAAPDERVREVRARGRRFLATTTRAGDATIVFLRDLDRELEILPRLRGAILWSAGGALLLALLLGAAVATRLGRPVRSLADEAERLARGDFGAPLPRSPILEVERMGRAFDAMRTALAARLAELEAVNRELADRQARLSALQAELIQRERAALSGRLVAELAHEIRNPVASLRNCLELIRRRLGHDREGRRFADLAIDELLRMHELAERMLDLNRPRDAGADTCDAAAVARESAALFELGRGEVAVQVHADGPCPAAVPPDALKQVLLNLAQNAREAAGDIVTVEITVRCEEERVTLEVADDGPGIPAEIRGRIFDPFFTTKGVQGGIGLGLFVADATLRRYGGGISLAEPAAGGGACFRLTLPAAAPAPAEAA